MSKRILQKGESVSYDYLVDETIQLNFGKTFDDFTLLHYDDDYAREVAFERRPMQGALISAIIVKSIVKAFGDSTILKIKALQKHVVSILKGSTPRDQAMPPRYYDPKYTGDLFTRFYKLRDQLIQQYPNEFSDFPIRQEKSSGTTDFENRGYYYN